MYRVPRSGQTARPPHAAIPLLITRFLFGAGEAGAFPNASIVVARWFPPTQRASIFGVLPMASQIGGMTSDALVRRLGVKWGRRSLGILGLGSACLSTIAVMFTRDQVVTVLLLTLVYAGTTFQQSGVFGVCLDIGKNHAGSVIGLMNTSLLGVGALLWLRIDASTPIGLPEPKQVVAS